MRKFIGLTLLALTFGIFVFFSCNKRSGRGEPLVDFSFKVTRVGQLNLSPKADARVATNIGISSEGYLLIPDSTALYALRSYLITHTHGQVKSLYQSEGFSSFGAVKFNSTYNSSPITPDQAAYYIVDANLLVQIERVLYRPIVPSTCGTRDYDFVLLMDSVNTTKSRLNSIRAGIFDSTAMNQLATDPVATNTKPVRQLMDSINYGYKEATASPCAMNKPRHPMFGSAGGCCVFRGNSEVTGAPVYWSCTPQQHTFWIHTGGGLCQYTSGCIDYGGQPNGTLSDCARQPPNCKDRNKEQLTSTFLI